jgi:hypothetical protein
VSVLVARVAGLSEAAPGIAAVVRAAGVVAAEDAAGVAERTIAAASV